MIFIYKIVDLTIRVIQTLILIRVILSWVAPHSRNSFTHLVYDLTEPILRPFRMLLPLGRMSMDISPILAYFVLNIVRRLVISLLF